MILDTSALAAIFFGEPETARYTQLIHDADRCLIGVANFVELCMVIESQIGPDASRQCDVFFRRAGILIEPLTIEHGHLARQAFLDFGKDRHPASLICRSSPLPAQWVSLEMAGTEKAESLFHSIIKHPPAHFAKGSAGG